MAARRRKRWKTILPTVTLTAAPFVTYLPAAGAFFPPVVTPPSVVEPVVPPPFVPPPTTPPIVVVPPVLPPPVVTDPCDPPTQVGTPEPATVVTGLVGLAAAAGYRAIRRKGSGTKEG